MGIQDMPEYHGAFRVGERVRIASLARLEDFHTSWRFHHPLSIEQMQFANREAPVSEVGFYHGGDPLYGLEGVPGLWHECCIVDPTLDDSPPANEVFWIKQENRNGRDAVVVRDTSGAACHEHEPIIWDGHLKGMSEVLRVRSAKGFASRYGFDMSTG